MQERLRSLRETVRAEIIEVKDAEEQSFDDHTQEVNIALMEMTSETLRQIDQAIRRLESGIYSACAECGGKIPWRRLRALPFVRLCRACQDEGDSCEAARRRTRLQGLQLENFRESRERLEPATRGSAGIRARENPTVGVRATATAAVGMRPGEAR